MSYIYNLTDTWNSAGTTFNAIKMDVTDTASASGSLLIDLQHNSVSQFHVTKGGANHLKRSNYNIASANTAIISASNYSLTGSDATSMFDLAGTWNTSGTPTAIKLNMTDTASAAASNLLDLQVGGSSRFSVRKDGLTTTRDIYPVADNAYTLGSSSFYWGGMFSQNVTIKDSGALGWQSADLFLRRDAANTLAQRNGTNAQTFRVYGTFTDASNYERGVVQYANVAYEYGSEIAGTGAARNVRIKAAGGANVLFATNGSDRWAVGTTGHFIANVDNTYDIGAIGASRPRNVFVGTVMQSLVVEATAAGYIGFDTRSRIRCPADGQILLRNNAENNFSLLQFGGTTNAFPALGKSGTIIQVLLADGSTYAPLEASAISGTGSVAARTTTPIPAGGAVGVGYVFSSTANFGVFFGSGAPALSAAKGSLYLRSDGTTTNDRMYVNTNGSTTWTAVTTAA